MMRGVSSPLGSRTGGRALLAAGFALVCLSVGAAIGARPLVAVAGVFAAVMVFALWTSARTRFLFVTLGGLLTLQSSQTLDLLKIAYLAGVGLALAAALADLSGREHDLTWRLGRPLRLVSGAYFGLVLISLPVALAHGVDFTSWLRDAASYLLFASTPIFALDASYSLSKRALITLFVIAGGFSCVSFFVTWIERRQLASLTVTHLGFPSFLLPGALFCFAVAAVAHGHGSRARWLALACSVIALLFGTATRSSAVLLVAIPVIAYGTNRGRIGRVLKLSIASVIGAISVYLLLQVLVSSSGASLSAVTQRLSTVGQVVSDPLSDHSYANRIAATQAALRVVEKNPLLGAGPGYQIPWTSVYGDSGTSYNMDTGLGYVAKFGIVGLVVLLLLGRALLAFLRALRAESADTVCQLALLGFAAVAMVWLPLGSVFDEKGFSFGFLFLVAIALADTRLPARPPSIVPYSTVKVG